MEIETGTLIDALNDVHSELSKLVALKKIELAHKLDISSERLNLMVLEARQNKR